MSRKHGKLKDEIANDFVELCSVLKCELMSEGAIKAEILDQSLDSDHNITDLVPVKLEEYENVYDSDVSIKEESFDPRHRSTDFNTTHDIQSDSCDRNKDITHSNYEDSLNEDIFSTLIEFTPTQTKKTVNENKTINYCSSKDLFSHSHHNDLRKSEEELKIDKKINGSFGKTAKTQPNNGYIKFKTVAQMRETLNNSKIKQNEIKAKTKSGKQKVHQCDQCEQIFTFYNNLLRHQKKHSDGRVICDYCKKDYNRKSYLAEHIQLVHLKIARNNTVFMCMICNKRLKSAYALRCHMRIHNGIKPFRCNVCKKEFSNKWNLTVHCKSKKNNCSLKS